MSEKEFKGLSCVRCTVPASVCTAVIGKRGQRRKSSALGQKGDIPPKQGRPVHCGWEVRHCSDPQDLRGDLSVVYTFSTQRSRGQGGQTGRG